MAPAVAVVPIMANPVTPVMNVQVSRMVKMALAVKMVQVAPIPEAIPVKRSPVAAVVLAALVARVVVAVPVVQAVQAAVAAAVAAAT